jgi:hypothetical protein
MGGPAGRSPPVYKLTREDPTAFAPPPAFGPFRVLHQIGVGALGPVFRTYEPTRDRLVAVKVFRLDITPEQARALADELARAAEAGLFHPSVVEPIAAGVEGTVAYRAEEYVAAESLDVAMRHYAPASTDKVLPFIAQLAGAIDFARAAGVGHGALHPRDIFVTPDEARATGFGVVDALERVGLRAPVRRPYSPPERVAGGAWGAPADVFSLAAIAFELLTARRPAGTGLQIGPIAGAPGLEFADQVRGVLARAMDEDPALRYPTALAFAAALEAAARGEGEALPDTAVAISSAPAVAEPDRIAVASGSAEAPARAAAAPEPDDIAAEREEDEAHWALSREEQATDEPRVASAGVVATTEETPEPVRADVAAIPAAVDTDPVDSVVRPGVADEQADFVLNEARAPEPLPLRPAPAREPVPVATAAPSPEPAKSTSRPVPVVASFDSRPSPSRPRKAPPTVFDTHDALLDHDLGGSDPAPIPERAPVTMLPVAFGLIVGLLLGFGPGYMVGRRTQAPPVADAASGSVASQSGRPSAEPGPAGTSSPPARDVTEQPITPSDPPPAAAGAAPDAPAPKPSAAPAAAAVRRGRIVVRSSPAGAGVTVNGDWRGRTPLPLDDLALGDYVIRVVQPGYEVVREDVTLTAAAPSRTLSLRLNRQAAPPPSSPRAQAPRASAAQTFTGSVFVDSRPRGARVLLDGKEHGVTPLRIPDVPVGSHIIRLELPDHRFWTNSITVTAGKSTPVTGSLEPIR